MANHDPDLQARLEKLQAEVDQNYGPPLAQESGPGAASHSRPKKGPLARIKANGLLPFYILAVPWAQEMIDQVFFQGRWNLPLQPRTLEGLLGILTSAFSHGGFGHLVGNSIAFVIFSWLILAKSRRDYWITVLIGWLGGEP